MITADVGLQGKLDAYGLQQTWQRGNPAMAMAVAVSLDAGRQAWMTVSSAIIGPLWYGLPPRAREDLAEALLANVGVALLAFEEPAMWQVVTGRARAILAIARLGALAWGIG